MKRKKEEMVHKGKIVYVKPEKRRFRWPFHFKHKVKAEKVERREEHKKPAKPKPIKLEKSEKYKIEKHRIISPGFVIILTFLFLLGATAVIYFIIQRDLRFSLVGFGLMFISLLAYFVTLRGRKGKRIEVHPEVHEKIKHELKKVEIKKISAPAQPSRFMKFLLALFILFFIFGVGSSFYFRFKSVDFTFWIVSMIIALLGIAGFVSVKSRLNRLGVAQPEVRKEKVVKVKVDEKVVALQKLEIEHLNKYVQDRIKMLERDKTPLDVLYEVLKQKKKLKYIDITRIFKVEIKKVDKWAKILQDNNLADIEVPAFGSSILKLKELKEEVKR